MRRKGRTRTAIPPRPGRSRRLLTGAVRARRGATLLLAVAAGALSCRRPDSVTIALAYGRLSPGIGDVIADAIADGSPRGAPSISIFEPVSVEPSVDQTAALRAAIILRQPNVVGVVGHASSRESLIAAPIYAAAGVPLLVPTGTSRHLADAGPWLLRLAPDDSVVGARLARVADERMLAQSITIFYSSDEYGADLRDGVVPELARRGLRVVAASPINDAAQCPNGVMSAGTAALVDMTLDQGRSDLVLIATRTDAGACLIHRIRSRRPDMPILVGDAVVPSAAVLAVAGGGAPTCGVTFWHFSLPDSASRDFVARYRRIMHAVPSVEDAMIYQSAMLIAHGVWTVGASPRRVRDYLRSLGTSRPTVRGLGGRIALDGLGEGNLIEYCVRGDSVAVLRPSP